MTIINGHLVDNYASKGPFLIIMRQNDENLGNFYFLIFLTKAAASVRAGALMMSTAFPSCCNVHLLHLWRTLNLHNFRGLSLTSWSVLCSLICIKSPWLMLTGKFTNTMTIMDNYAPKWSFLVKDFVNRPSFFFSSFSLCFFPNCIIFFCMEFLFLQVTLVG